MSRVYPPLTHIVEPIPSILCDSTDEEDPEIHNFDPQLLPQNLINEDLDHLPGWDAPRPFAGRGKPLSEAIQDAWASWRDMLFEDADAGSTESRINLALALWTGHTNYRIEVDRAAALDWAQLAANEGPHERYVKGGCGPENCHKCYAIGIVERMQGWLAEEEREKDANMAQIVVLRTPNLLFRILSFCDVETLLKLRTLNSYWRQIINDSRAWAHINMFEAFPIPILPPSLASFVGKSAADCLFQQSSSNDQLMIPPTERDATTPLRLFQQLAPIHRNTCRVCHKPITIDHYVEACTIPDPFWNNFVTCRQCFYLRSQGSIIPYSLQGVKMLLLHTQLKHEAELQLHWEKHAWKRVEILNINQYTLETLPPPQKPAQYDEYATFCKWFEEERPDLLEMVPLFQVQSPNGPPEYFDEDSEDEDNDDDDEQYGQLADDTNISPKFVEKNHNDNADGDNIADNDDEDADNDDDIDVDAFLNGEDFSLFDDSTVQNSAESQQLIQEYIHKNDMVQWYSRSLRQYEQLAYILLLRRGLYWTEYDNANHPQAFQYKPIEHEKKLLCHSLDDIQDVITDKNLDKQDCYYPSNQNLFDLPPSLDSWNKSTSDGGEQRSYLFRFPHMLSSTQFAELRPTSQQLNTTSTEIHPIPRILPLAIAQQNSSQQQSSELSDSSILPTESSTGQQSSDDPQQLLAASEHPTLENTPTCFDPAAPPAQTTLTSSVLSHNTHSSHIPHFPSIPRAILQLIRYHAIFPNPHFLVDTSPLWHVLSHFTIFRRQAKMFPELDDIVVEYPTAQQYLFSHGDSRYGPHVSEPNPTLSQFSPIAQPTTALPLVYEIIQCLLRISTGFQYLKYREFIFNNVLPQFDLVYNKSRRLVQHNPSLAKELLHNHQRKAKGE